MSMHRMNIIWMVNDFAIFATGAGYKSAMQLLQEAQPAAGRAAGRAGHKSALELLREVP